MPDLDNVVIVAMIILAFVVVIYNERSIRRDRRRPRDGR
jgi:hypothetical protein